uniref:BTB/POZ and MATH domain-containing protein 2-like n=1 Tax=Ananas comosus var. bracteatus TaxID=296719 RepID=A0A6V7P5H1_ANACO|nr:unnamed protein product [Ananas comosus var. bracteatus]
MAASSSSSSSALVTEAVSGSHRFKISGYSLMKGIGPGKIYDSAAFTVGGFDWAIRYYPGGQSQDDADYISLFVVLACEAMDVKAQYKITLLDHWKRPSAATGSPYGSVPPQPPPSGLHLHLLQLLESGEGTDVAFEVGGETFAAHRWLLAARSPVFKVELLGPMKEKSMQRIKIEDVEAVVFKALLHFIYSDSVPDLIKELAKESPALMAQHLLAAADRYGLERLRLICEDKLCEQVDVSTVATTLALAEQHRCDRLKAACLEFVASPEVLIAVMLTDGFEHLKKSCPLVVNDLMEKFGCLFYSIRKEQSENEN